MLPSVAIVGAGVIGLGIGWRLARAGCPVTVFDRAEAGRGASWAAAGMLAAGIETEPSEDRLLGLTRFSQRLWPDFARSLEAETGLDVEYRDEGTLAVAFTRDDVQRLRFSYEHQVGLGIELEWLSGTEARRREPYLKPGLAAAVFSPGDHQVDNRLVVTALKGAFSAAGGKLHEHTPVTAIDIHADRVRGVRTADRAHAADVVVLAAGAWSRHIGGLPADLSPPIRPLKGQMLAARMDPLTPLLSHVLWAPGVYLVPRRNGRLLIGATTEERGFDESMTVGGVYALLDAAWRALPGIEELPIEEMWVGFRPGSRDDAPILGDSRIAGLIFASGHHRNGILLLPATVDAVGRLILRGEKIPEIKAFGIERFG
jgi:glycine oxidase